MKCELHFVFWLCWVGSLQFNTATAQEKTETLVDEMAAWTSVEPKCSQLLGVNSDIGSPSYISQVTREYDVATLKVHTVERQVEETVMSQKTIGSQPTFKCKFLKCSVKWDDIQVNVPEVRLKSVSEIVLDRSSELIEAKFLRINPIKFELVDSRIREEIGACVGQFNVWSSNITITRIEAINSKITKISETSEKANYAPFLLELNESLIGTVKADANAVVEVAK